ncbi:MULTISPECIES: MBL fold metallo-hydrolase [unclassified Imperialibacter]|uniref:MBL fold metallo-hydrolase n=1 Tax=unclassified Imperialibacter TaxID=2629706 RepID=UPI001256319D|nr:MULTISPECIES: MBL fold metallo-hydrolase [unclassified Imperialibacter]CAD5264812.1 Rhodanese [Imperialibacter sp. 89]CAD5269688.1 Rhodanese [Imperialibacter sp. 75]VVT09309.1 Rhodanese [Imperialibacter sp. EC-SDR9]
MDGNTISAKDLQKILSSHEPVFVLDVRPQSQRDEWHIPGSTHRDAYSQLNGGDYTVLDDVVVPPHTPVVTLCAAGKTSLIAADVLRKKGIRAYSLEGGMKAWNFAWNTAEINLSKTDLQIIQVRRAAKGCLSYVIGSGGEAAVVDASLDPEVYLNLAKANDWQIRYVMDTHVHADYLSRTRELAAASGAKHLFIKDAEVDYTFTPVMDGDKINLGQTNIEIIHTPGHTQESTSYLLEGRALLTGDTLFTDGVGRPDLKANRAEAMQKAGQLYDSLQRLLKLSGDTIILPAHISKPVSFDEKAIKGVLADLHGSLDLLQFSKEQFVEASLQRIPATPSNYLTIAELNKKGIFAAHQPSELEAGANRCGIA